MDPISKPVDKILKRLEWIAIPNLGILIVGLAVLGYVGQELLNIPISRFEFDPYLVRQGEYWRLLSYPLIGGPIWLIFYVLYVYFVMNALEQTWGTSRLTIFTALSYFGAIGAALITNQSLSIWTYVVTNISLAFGILFPEMEFYLFFILPVKAKWLALLSGALILFQFVVGSITAKLFYGMVHFPILLFFGPYLVQIAMRKLKR